MALHTRIVLTDDLDGSTVGVTSHQFALDGVTFEIDLSEANLGRLRDVLLPFQTAGRRLPSTSATKRGAASRAHAGNRLDIKEMRRWWKNSQRGAGLPPFSEKGRIPATVEGAYRSAHRAAPSVAFIAAEPVAPGHHDDDQSSHLLTKNGSRQHDGARRPMPEFTDPPKAT